MPGDQGKRLGPGIDVKADGGYVVAAPSRHPVTGLPYTWADYAARVEEMSPALAGACAQPVPRRPATTHTSRPLPARSAGDIPHPNLLMAALTDRIAATPAGRRRLVLYGCARGTARIVTAGHLTTTGAYDWLVAACDAAGWPWSSATHHAIRDGFAAEGVTL
ncbi:hypothetical protein Cs7R123_47930 [Catellatospora sp. TT07R-123]|nr:hypothetical protein Cs7R123_47930 [Catellatospora sp. TT07R-123]